MKIKTIVRQLGDAANFDKDVNAALADGWVLTKRDVLQLQSQPNDGCHYLHTMLYAELEKRDEAEINHRCATCGHFDDVSGYCDNCRQGNKWEPTA